MRFNTVAGIGGVVFALAVSTANVLLASAAKPLGDVELSKIVAYYVEHGSGVRLLGWVAPIGWLCISLFAAGVVTSTRDSEGRLNGWAALGFLGIATMIPTFCGVVTVDLVLAVGATTLAERPQFTRALWDFHLVLQILNLAFVAIALAGFAMAAVTSRLGPWLGRTGLVGAALLMFSATQSSSVMAGSRAVVVALPGFLIWLIFVLGLSVKMIRLPAVPQPA